MRMGEVFGDSVKSRLCRIGVKKVEVAAVVEVAKEVKNRIVAKRNECSVKEAEKTYVKVETQTSFIKTN